MPKWSQRPEEVLEQGGLAEYEQGRAYIYGALITLNAILYIAKRILEFPWRLFGRQEEVFFSIVMRSLHDSAILIVTKLVADQGNDPFTLTRFKNRVRGWMKPALAGQFKDHLLKAKFDRTINEIIAKARDVRNHVIAHTSPSFVSGNLQLYRPSLSELENVCAALQKLFDELSFDVQHMMLPLDYDPTVMHGATKVHKPDIEHILDSVARDSPFFNMLERQPEAWKYRRAHVSAQDLATLNHYRRKFELPNA